MYFRLGGGTLKGIARPGEVVWSRIYVMDDALHMDIGLAEALTLSNAETKRRSEGTTPQWPMMHARLRGVDRNQLMGRHKANHIQVAYADDLQTARRAARMKAELATALGISVHQCGVDL
jgi:hypothetical protein